MGALIGHSKFNQNQPGRNVFGFDIQNGWQIAYFTRVLGFLVYNWTRVTNLNDRGIKLLFLISGKTKKDIRHQYFQDGIYILRWRPLKIIRGIVYYILIAATIAAIQIHQKSTLIKSLPNSHICIRASTFN